MQRTRNVSTFVGFDNEYEESKIVVFGAPFDGTTSFRPGTRFAPDVMRSESYGLETYSPYFDKDLTEINIFDAGDLEFGFGNTEKVLKAIKEFTQGVVADGKIPFMIGGEHLVSYPAVEAVFEKYKDLRIIHFDAHTDLRDEFKGERLSHATVLKRIWDFVGDGKMYHFGIRSGDGDEFRWAEKHVKLTKFNTNGLDEAIKEIGNHPVYVTIDLDVLDPSVFPGTGTPEAGGISFHEMMDAILAMKDLNIVGLDVVELSPHYDPSGVSNAVACKIVRELALAAHK